MAASNQQEAAHGTRSTPPLLLADSDFRRLFVADAVSKVGTQVSYLAVPLLALRVLHATARQVGFIGALGSLAFLVVGLPAGVWVEHGHRRRIMVIADVIRAVLMASLPLAWVLHRLSLAQVYIVVAAVGLATVFFDVASGAYVPHLVGRDQLLQANGALSSASAGAEIAGRGVGGLIVQIIAAPFAVVVDASSYLVSALFLSRIRRDESSPLGNVDRHLWRELMEGLGFVFHQRVLRTLALETAWSNACLRMIITLVPVLFIRELRLADGWIGVFLAVGGAGVLAGSVSARAIGKRLGFGRALWIVGAGCGPFVLMVPLMRHGFTLWLAFPAWLVTTYKVGVDNVLKSSLRQRICPDRMLSRMVATYRFLITGALSVGSMLAGVLADATTVRTALWIAAVGLAGSWLLLFFSPLRTMHSLPTLGSGEAGRP
jgi:MFS family permease